MSNFCYNDKNYDRYPKESSRMYFDDCKNYPLLDPKEEAYYATLLYESRNSKLLNIYEYDGCRIYNLNIELLFSSLCDNKEYEFVINSLIDCYSKIEVNDAISDKICKYNRESKKIHRSLNKEELKSLFNIDYNEMHLTSDELLSELKKFINFKLAYYKMIVSNLRLVGNIAFKLIPYVTNSGINVMDLVGEGNICLTKAVDNYDVSLGFKFSTYATKCIRQGILNYISNYKSAVRIPDYYKQNINTFKKQALEYEKMEGRSLSPEELAILLSMDVQEVNNYLMLLETPVSLDSSIGEEENMTLGDTISSSIDVEDDALRDFLINDIEVIYQPLTEREKMVIQMQFGIGEYKKHSLIEISKILGLSPQRVTQIAKRALFIMKLYAKRVDKINSLKEYVR